MQYIVIGLILFGLLSFYGDDTSVKNNDNSYKSSYENNASAYSSYSNYADESEEENLNTISRDAAISDHWDEIKEHLNGSSDVEACTSSGCYDLNSEISGGQIEQVNFPNGGYLTPDEEISNDGSASGFDTRGRNWDYNLDMNSGVVDDAVQEWADENDYTVE